MKTYRVLPAFMLTLLLFGCITTQETAPMPAPQDISVFPYLQLAPAEPPAAPSEIIPDSAEPTKETWRPGFWTYDGSTFQWANGRYIGRPHPTASWSRDHWEERSYGWAFIPGYWH